MTMQWLLVIIPVVLLLIGVPIALSLVGTAMVYMLLSDVPLVAAAQRVYTALDQFTLTAIPAFMLAGAIMEQAGISRRLVDFAMRGVGRYKAGMPKVTVLSSMMFGGMSGAAAADSAAVGAVMVPEMVRHNYPRPYSAALVAASSICAVLIPPSIPLVFYGILASTSIDQLLLAGAVPGLLAGLALMTVVHFQKEALEEKHFEDTQPLIPVILRALPVLALPLIILGGIFFGWVTATEAAVVAVAYALVLGCIGLRSLSWRDAARIFSRTAVNSSTVMILIALASVYSWILTRELIPQQIAEAVLALSNEKWAVLLLINLLLLVVGCVLDTGSAMIIFVSIFFPVATQLQIDPVHFGVIMVFNLAIGMLTPPVGICLMVASSVSGVSMQHLIRPVLPFILTLLALLALVTYVPSISLWLPTISAT